MTETSNPTLTVRALARDDLNAVVAIDAVLEGRPRRAYVCLLYTSPSPRD